MASDEPDNKNSTTSKISLATKKKPSKPGASVSPLQTTSHVPKSSSLDHPYGNRSSLSEYARTLYSATPSPTTSEHGRNTPNLPSMIQSANATEDENEKPNAAEQRQQGHEHTQETFGTAQKLVGKNEAVDRIIKERLPSPVTPAMGSPVIPPASLGEFVKESGKKKKQGR